jgi:hypothetical protein
MIDDPTMASTFWQPWKWRIATARAAGIWTTIQTM